MREATGKPDFLVIGAMKCATTTLHRQFAAMPGICCGEPKEVDFFNDDANYARGMDWYRSHFEAASPDDLWGEFSTSYTKLPTFPDCADRIREHLPDVKLVYLMRHPVDRLLSHFVFDARLGLIPPDCELDAAIAKQPGLVDYGLYAYQLQPYIDRFGFDRILPVAFDRFVTDTRSELTRIMHFLGREYDASLVPSGMVANASQARLRRNFLTRHLVRESVLKTMIRRFVPESFRTRFKQAFRSNLEKPPLSAELETRLVETFDGDLRKLGGWLGLDLCCKNFHEKALAEPWVWRGDRA